MNGRPADQPTGRRRVAKRRVRPLAVACLALVLAALGLSACTSRAQPETLTVLGPWKADPATGTGGERAAFLAMVQPFEARNNVRVRYESPPDPDAVLTARLRGGTPPDLVGLSDYGELLALSADHSLQPLEGVVDLPRLRDEYGTWLSLGQSGGHQMAIVIKVALKGLVWYSKPAFAAAGYQPPQDWTAALALAGRMSARYGAAWCLGLEAGSTSGWPGTDWLEDILLDQAGPVVYDKWARVRLPWTSPEVRRAWQTWGQLLAAPRAVAGGRLGALVTNYVSADQSLLASPARCGLDHQASFITGLVGGASSDLGFFRLPVPGGRYPAAREAGGDLFGMLRDSPLARELVRYLATPEAQEIWVRRGGAISPNRQVPLTAYSDPVSRAIATTVADTTSVSFDASDLMPPAMQAAFYNAVLAFVAGGTPLDDILKHLEDVRLYASPSS